MTLRDQIEEKLQLNTPGYRPELVEELEQLILTREKEQMEKLRANYKRRGKRMVEYLAIISKHNEELAYIKKHKLKSPDEEIK